MSFCPLRPYPEPTEDAIVAASVAFARDMLASGGPNPGREDRFSDLETRLRGLFTRTRAGDPEAAEKLFGRLTDHSRIAFVNWCFTGKLPCPVLQAVLRSAWVHHIQFVRAAAYGERRTVVHWLRRCAFVPSELPNTVTIYRGTNGVTPARAARGLSWTRNYDIACTFALGEGKPLVLRRRVPRYDVLAVFHDREEVEIVTASPVRAKVHGTPEEWLRRGQAEVARIRTAMLSRIAVRDDAAVPGEALAS